MNNFKRKFSVLIKATIRFHHYSICGSLSIRVLKWFTCTSNFILKLDSMNRTFLKPNFRNRIFYYNDSISILFVYLKFKLVRIFKIQKEVIPVTSLVSLY